VDLSFWRDNWDWISSNWWGAVSLVIFGILFGAGAAKLYFQWPGKAKSDGHAPEDSVSSERFKYPEHGRHGKNVLSNFVNDVTVNEQLSLRAEVPSSSRLTMEILGPPPTTLDDNGGSWHMRVGQTVNWSYNTYISEHGGKQQFRAEGGTADLQITFAREGTVRISVYEGDATAASWGKTLQVHGVA
jgi:hypothetical protein